MKILILAENQYEKYNWGHQLFRDEIAKQHDVIFFGPGYIRGDISLKKYLMKNKLTFDDFDFVFTHGLKYTKKIKDIYTIPKNLLKVHYVVDFFEEMDGVRGRDKAQYEFLNLYKPDIIFSVYHNSIKPLQKNVKNNNNIFVLPFSACNRHYKNYRDKKNNQVVACFSTREDVYPNRLKALSKLKNNKIKIIKGKTRFDYIGAINESKISLGVCDIYKSLNMRVTEILSCGGFLLTDKPNYIDNLGLIENIHYVTYNSFDDMIDKCIYYFDNDKIRRQIELNGMTYVHKHHSCFRRVQQMIKIINKIK